MRMPTIFERIISGEIPSVKIHEDDECIAILDTNPIHKGHALVISKDATPTVSKTPDERLMHMIVIAKRIDEAQKKALGSDGSNILINNGPAAGQEVPHLHIHVIPRYKDDGYDFSGFGHERYEDGEMQEIGEKLCID